MPTPSVALNTLRPDLATFWQISFAELEGDMICSRLMPTHNPRKQSGNFGRKTLESIARHDSDIDRAPGSGYKRRRYEFEQDTYATTEKGIEEILDDREVDMYMDYTAAEEFATRRAVHSVLIERERRCAATVVDVAYYSGDPSLNQAVTAGVWSLATSTPITDVELAFRKVRNNTGVTPNALVIPYYTFRDLRLNPQVQAAINSNGISQIRARDINIDHLRAVFDIDNILVGDTLRNTANVGQSAVITDIWPNHAFVTKIATSGDFSEPCIGRTLHWSEDGSEIDGRVESYREENIRSSIYRARHDYQHKILYKDLACLIPNVRT